MQQDEFLNKVQNYGDLDSTDEALRMTEIFLGTLGEWLYRTEVHNLAAQLPRELQGFLYRERDPERVREQTEHLPLEEFYNRIKARADVTYKEAARIAHAVARVLQEAISPGEMEDVLEELPDEFGTLFSTEG